MMAGMSDRDILRTLAGQVAEIAALPVHREKAELWRRLNRKEAVRPMVWINEIPWAEFKEAADLTVHCRDPWARGVETHLRRTLYQWHHFPGDMIVGDSIESPIVWHSSGLGVSEKLRSSFTDPNSGIISREFDPQIVEPKDVERINTAPVVTRDDEATERIFARMEEIFGGILPVRKTGIKHLWFTPWDHLIRWWGVQEAMLDLVMRPAMVNEAVSRFVTAKCAELDRMEELGLLSLGNNNTRVGSGGYGYTDELPGADCDPSHLRPADLWGCSNAQIFSEVSPEMHWEFAVRHDLRYLERWGLVYYGCCEPLDLKMEVLRRIPNLRKVSMSPWIDLDRAVRAVKTDYVFSYKPNPAFLAEDTWRPERVRKSLEHVLDRTRDCHVELILKDISTCRCDPARISDWETIAMDLVEHVE